MLNVKARTFWVLVYKTDNTFYKDGQNQALHCLHVNSGNYGMNSIGEIMPLPGALVVDDGASPPNEFLVPVGADAQGTVFPSTTQFGDRLFRAVTKIKDMVLLKEFYVDTASYNANMVTCNPVSGAGCGITTGVSVENVGDGSVNITWPTVAGSIGIEYFNNQSSAEPTTDGTFIAAGVGELTIEDLENEETYHFWIRTVCTSGKSQWTSAVYTVFIV